MRQPVPTDPLPANQHWVSDVRVTADTCSVTVRLTEPNRLLIFLLIYFIYLF